MDLQPARILLQVDLPMADVAFRQWLADPTALLLALLPATVWAATTAHAGDPVPALLLAALIAATALSGST